MEATEMRRERSLFSISGIEIAVDLSWGIIFVLVLWSLSAGYFPQAHPGHSRLAYWMVGLAGTLLFFASVLIHELSHAVVGNRLGQEVRRITLFVFGGMAHLSREPQSPSAEMKIAAAGPLTSLVLAVLFEITASISARLELQALVTAMFEYLAFINVALAIFNLLPGFPLDGGRLMRAFLWHRSGDLRAATARAANWGSGIGLGLMVLGGLEIFSGALVGGLWLIFIGMFLRGAARMGYYGVALEMSIGTIPVRESMVPDPITIDPDVSVASAVEDYFLRHGYAAFPVARDGHVEGVVSLSAVQRCERGERDRRQVREIMEPLRTAPHIEPSATLSEALRKMAESNASRLLVTEGDRLRGLITRSMIMRMMQVRTALEKPAAATG